MKQALLVIDVQNDYFDGGKMPLSNPESALSNINLLENKFRAQKLPIIYIQHIKHMKNADFFEAGTIGANLHKNLTVDCDDIIIEKHFPNSFLETNLLETLQNLEIEQLVITGMMTHMCVDSTTRAARELGFQPILVSDSTATKALEFDEKLVKSDDVQASFLAALSNFATVVATKEALNMIK